MKKFGRMSDLDLTSFLDGFIKGDERQAVVFEDLEYMMYLAPHAQGPLWTFLRKLNRDSTGEKIVVFVSNSRRISSIRGDRDDRDFLHSFGDEFFLDDDAVLPNVIRVGSPSADEMLNLQRRFRLRDQIPTHFPSLARNCEANAAELRGMTDLQMASLKSNLVRIREFDWTMETEVRNAMASLAALPGRGDVAERIRRDTAYAKHQQGQVQHGDSRDDPNSKIAVDRLLDADKAQPAQVNLSYAMAGHPGTGKTVIARLIAEHFKEAGVLQSGHFIEATVQDLVASHVGETALKASDLLDRALGGVLFIDEVQGFEKDTQFHREAIRTILKYAEDHRGSISIIVATYPDKMEGFLSIDDGLARRFSQRIDLDDYDAATCAQIFEHMAKDQNVEVNPDLREKLEGFFEAWINDQAKREPFANAGSVRNLVEEMSRVRFDAGSMDKPFSVEDIPEEFETYIEEASRWAGNPEARLDHAVAELQDLPGLANVKDMIERIVVGIKAQRLRAETVGIRPGHYAFEGNPGTGKTTVARLLGRLFRELGVLKSGHVVEVTRSELVGRYQGHSAQNVRQVAQSAMDGVLFLDEAHNLVQSEQDSFGREAVGELTAIIENDRDRLCFIAAGYREQMARLFEADPGWDSRFSARLRFDDYEPDEMEEILRLMCSQQRRTLHPDLASQIQPVLSRLRDDEGAKFANGRSIRSLLDEMNASLDARFVAKPDSTDPYQFIPEDLPHRLRR